MAFSYNDFGLPDGDTSLLPAAVIYMKRSVAVCAFLLLFTGLLAAQEPSAGAFWTIQAAPEEAAQELLSRMSPEEIVSQVFLVGWPQEKPTPLIMEWIRRRNIGGVKIFGWNGENLYTLARAIATMQNAALNTPHGIPLFTATDQEGGWVRHIKGATSVTPGNMAIGATGLPYDAMETGYYIGMELRALGVNMNFAPDVDVYVNPEAHVIGPRAFGDNATETAVLGTAYFKGLEKARVIATAKHFPGHGNAKGDSHGMLPVIPDTMDTLWNRDLVPYRFLIREGLPAILSGHLNFPEVTHNGVPASLSQYFKHTVLRERLHFKGIAITDDLYMGGAEQYAAENGISFPQLCVDALSAGNDMIMLSKTPGLNDAIWTAVFSAYQNNPDFHARINEAVTRILTIKFRYLQPENRVPLSPDTATISDLIPDRAAQPFFRDQAARSVTVIRDGAIPFKPERGTRILLAGKDRDFFREGKRRFPDADLFSFTDYAFYTASAADRARFARLAGKYDTVIFCLSDPNSLQVLEAARNIDTNIVVISILTPVYLQQVPWVKTAIAVYGWGKESLEAGFAVLRGDYTAEGSLPVSMLDR